MLRQHGCLVCLMLLFNSPACTDLSYYQHVVQAGRAVDVCADCQSANSLPSCWTGGACRTLSTAALHSACSGLRHACSGWRSCSALSATCTDSKTCNVIGKTCCCCWQGLGLLQLKHVCTAIQKCNQQHSLACCTAKCMLSTSCMFRLRVRAAF
jgi:hypothetical protein